MRRLAITNKGCVQLTSNDTYFADSWFSSVKTSEEMASAGVDYCEPVKTSHNGFYLAMFLSSYIRTVDERLAGRVLSCYEDYSKSFW